MSVLQVLFLAGLAVLIGFLKKGRSLVLLVVNVLLMYWLQPIQEPVNFVFWLPTIMLALIVIFWVITSAPEVRGWQVNWKAILALTVTVLVVDSSRHFAFDYLIAVDTPRIQWVVPILMTALFLVFASSRFGKFHSSIFVGAGFGLVGLLFLVKTPSAFSVILSWLTEIRGKAALVSSISWLGFSYVSFRLLHTLFDRISGRLPPLALMDYLNYVIFFPSFTAGPIDRAERFVHDLNNPAPLVEKDWLEAGMRLFLGLFKKFVIADALGWIALNEAYLLDARSAGWVWIFLYAYSLQIYFDFSGYTDIVVGLGRLMGIRLPENFNAPYLKPNLRQFWNSWHMTLTQWFRSYFFNPLARKMQTASRPLPASGMILISQIATMTLIGLWHGVTLNFVLWGVWHGLGLFLQNRWSEWLRPFSARAFAPVSPALIKYAGVFVTFNFVSVGWLFFIFSEPALVWTAFLRMAGAQ